MKRIKIMYLGGILLIVIIILMIYSNTNKLSVEYKGYGFYQDVDKKISSIPAKNVDIIIDAYLNDSNLNNDRIEISYDDIKIIENILITNGKNGFWTGTIVHYDNVNAHDEVLGDIVLLDKGKECFIHLYNENLNIVTPADNIDIAIQKYFDFYIKNSAYKLK